MGWEEGIVELIEKVVDLIPIRMVHSYEQAVKYNWGKDVALIKKPGVKIYVPFRQKIVIVDVRYETKDLANLSIVSSDNKSITACGAIEYRVINARKYHTQVSNDLPENLEIRARGFLSRIARQYKFEEMVSQIVTSNQQSDSVVSVPLVSLAATGTEDISYSAEDLTDDQDDEHENNNLNGASKLEISVLNALQADTRKFGVKICNFFLTDFQNTIGIRHFGDIDTKTIIN